MAMQVVHFIRIFETLIADMALQKGVLLGGLSKHSGYEIQQDVTYGTVSA